MFLEISENSQENTCARVSFLIQLQETCNSIKKEAPACNFIKKETVAKVFLRRPLLTEHLWTTASVKAMMMTRCFKHAKVLIISLRSLFCSVCVDSCSKFSVRFIASSLLFQGNYTVLSFNELGIILAFFLFLLCMAVVFFGFSSFYSFVCCFLFVFCFSLSQILTKAVANT